ncbi:MAG: hypothetical protein RIQ46_1812 [Pseudomonadota bacterium]|jgi:PhzF family phenazine biosynthesis protein
MRLDLVDVFGAAPLRGNPLAVVRGADGLSGEAMLALTRWLGFSETTFLLPPTDAQADYRVRIFYPAGELPFAGHPTLGSARAWLAAGGTPRDPACLVQECGIGLVPVRVEDEMLAFRAPEMIRTGPLSDAERAEALRVAGVDPDAVVEAVHADNGPGWKLLLLRSAADVLAAQPVAKAPPGADIGLAGPCPPGSGADWELRAFFSDGQGQMREDPVTGSLNAGVARHLFAQGLAAGSYVAAQGRCTGADGQVDCRQEADGAVWISGRAAMIAAGADLTLGG